MRDKIDVKWFNPYVFQEFIFKLNVKIQHFSDL